MYVYSVLAYAQICFEDTYILIHDTDGHEWANKLRRRMRNEFHGSSVGGGSGSTYSTSIVNGGGGLNLNMSTSLDSHESAPLLVPPTIQQV